MTWWIFLLWLMIGLILFFCVRSVRLWLYFSSDWYSLWYFVLVRSELMFSSKICLSLRLLGMLLSIWKMIMMSVIMSRMWMSELVVGNVTMLSS